MTRPTSNVVRRDIHSRKLPPDLRENTDVGAVEHLGLEGLQVRHVGVVALKFAHLLNLAQLAVNKRSIGIAFAVYES